MDNDNDEYIYGRNAVLAFLEAGQSAEANETTNQLDKIFLAEGSSGPDKRIDLIKKLAREHKVPISVSNKQQLERLVGRESRHQGVVARLSQSKSLTLSEFLQSIQNNNQTKKNNLVVLVDSIQDPQNLGTIIRAAHGAGAKGLITTFRRAAGTTAAVAKASAGALAKLPIVKVQNLVAAMDELKKHGFWIGGLDAEAPTKVFDQDLRLPLAVVIGSEGKGLGRLVTDHCDFLVSIPMAANCESLNAAVAAGIVFYEYIRQNHVKEKASCLEVQLDN